MNLEVRGFTPYEPDGVTGEGYTTVLGRLAAQPTTPGSFIFVRIEPDSDEVIHVECPLPQNDGRSNRQARFKFVRIIVMGERAHPVLMVRLYVTDEDLRTHTAATQFAIQLWDGELASAPHIPPSASAGWPPARHDDSPN